MNKRNCPVCNSATAYLLMKFTPELLAAVNPTYVLNNFKRAVKGKEDLLTYSQCRQCGMIYCENVWDEFTLKEVYENSIDHNKSRNKILDIKKRLSLVNTWNNVLRILSLHGKTRLDNLKIVDYGCGWGDFLEVVNGYGVDAVGYDEDSKKIELPKQRGHKIIDNVGQLKDHAPVDVFVMNSVLEHLQDVDAIFKLINITLKQDGLLVFSVMDYRSKYINKNIERLKINMPALTKNLNPVEHVNVYNYDSVMKTLNKYGFRCFSTRHVLYLTDTYFFRERCYPIKIFNLFEHLSSKILKGRELGIQVYALKNKWR